MSKNVCLLGLVISILSLATAIMSASISYFFGINYTDKSFAFMGNGYPIIPALFATCYFTYHLRGE